jgi:type I restriction enzyme S subunit
MNPARLLAHFERLADAPVAVPRLRRFVLDLAVRGKLVEQDPNDEPEPFPASAAGSKPFPASAAGSKRERPRELANDEAPTEQPYTLPRTWRWVRIGDQLELLNGMAFKPSDWVPSGIRIVRIQNLNRPEAPFNYCEPKRAREQSLIDDGAFLISWSGTPGTSFGAFIWDRGPAVLNQHIFRCDFKTSAFSAEYLRLAINGRLDEMIENAHGGVGLQHITKGKLEAMLIGLPPRAEQHRIVAKVDELMGLCDRLEAARNERESRRDRLVTASLHRLSQPEVEGNDEPFRTDARFYLNHLPHLTTRPEHVKQLRQTTLNLAVRGRLVPQDAEDPSVEEMLSDFEHQQTALITLKALKRSVSRAELEDENALPMIPPSWCWAPLGKLISFGPQNGISPKPTADVDAPKAITLTATTSGYFDGSRFKHVEANIPPDSDLWLQEGDLLFQRGNTREYVGMAAYYQGSSQRFLYPDLMIKVRILKGLCLRYLHLASISPQARAYFSEKAAGGQETMPKINHAILLNTPIPLPPLAEQHRIVAKVDELMALCDRLEASLAETEADSRHLLEAVLHEALQPAESALEAAD